MGGKTDRLRCEVCQNLNLSPINTGPLRHAVATVLTVYGIETVLLCRIQKSPILVATVLTVYGIETREKIYLHTSLRSYRCNSTYRLRY